METAGPNGIWGTSRMQIASAHGSRQDEIQIKAKVLMDYIDRADGDAVHNLAVSLCGAIIATSDMNRN